MSYSENRAFGDKFMPQVKAILGQLLLRDDFQEEDQKHNTDLLVLRMSTQRIGVRIRKPNVWTHKDENGNYVWRNQFTIRFSLSTGNPTEFDKILYNNWGNFFFYGIAEKEERFLIKWTVGDLDAFRAFANKEMQLDREGFINKHLQHNKGYGDSDFLAFDFDEVPAFVLSQSQPVVENPTATQFTNFLMAEPIVLKGVTA